MAETYCGKTCTECVQKEALNCLGSKTGPGRQYSGSCELARCCREKGHQECTTCGFNGNCGTLRRKEQMPEYRRRSMEAEKAKREAAAKRAPVLGRWLWVLFWLFIPRDIASLVTNENIVTLLPQLYIPGLILRAVCTVAYSVILLRLSSEEERYRTAGICVLVGAAVSILASWLSDGAWILLLAIPSAILSLMGEYNEFTAHAAVLEDVDRELAGKWTALWKWFIGMYCAVLGSLLIIVIIPILGLLITFGSSIGVLVVSILKLVYLYRTANFFRSFAN